MWSAGWLAALGALAGLPMALPAQAQGVPVVSHEVVQPLPTGNEPPSNQSTLNEALTRLGRNPRDVEALVDAGRAALALGDASAATGFLMRADRLSPNNPRVLAWLGAARVRSLAPLEALPLFDAAERSGPLRGDPLTDRGLAYDMVGDNVSAQRYYRQALETGADDEATRRLALSQAIAGDRKGAEATLAPLLQKQDRAAWRTRAFAFAIDGREDEAVGIAKATMPAEMAEAISPYLRYMRRLTPAQQATAANLGVFPRASQIGQDDPAITRWAAAHGVTHMAMVTAEETAVRPSAPPQAPEAQAEPAGKHKHHAEPARSAEPAKGAAEAAQAVPPPEPRPTREVTQPARTELASNEPARASVEPSGPPASSVPPEPVPTTSAQPAPVGTASMAPERTTVQAAPPQFAAVPPAQPKPAYTRVAEAEAHPVRERPRATPHEAPRPTRFASFAEAFSAWGKADDTVRPVSGAVDIRKIKARRPAPKAPPPPRYPSRAWVQIGVGRQESRIAFDWHRMERDEPKLLKGRKPYITDWGRTNRLLIGPFADEDAAKAYLVKLKKAGHEDAFVWLSPEGQAVDPLDD